MAIFKDGAIALKIARRSVMRNKLQSFLIIAIIAVPVLLVSTLLTFDASTKSTAAEQVKFELGLAKAKFEIQLSPNENLSQNPSEFYLQEIVPDGTSARNELVDIHQALPNTDLLAISKSEAIFKTAAGIGPISVFMGHSWDTVFLGHGPVDLLSGNVPKSSDEVLLSPSALKRFGVQLGEAISTEGGQKFRVVGTLRDYASSSTADIVFAGEGAITDGQASSVVYYQIGGESPDWKEVSTLNKQGIAVLSRSVLLNPPSPEEQVLGQNSGGAGLFVIVSVLFFLVPLVLLPVVVLAGSAFAFGARRQTRTLAVMSSLGASRKTLQNVTIASGVWLGLLGGLSGVVLGVLVVAFFGPAMVTQSLSVQPGWSKFPGFHVPWVLLIVLIICSCVLGAISSYLPARKASRVNILATLRGQRTEGQVRARSGIGALILLLVGLVIVVLSSLLFTFAESLPLESASDFETKGLLQRFAVYGQLAGGIVSVIGFMVGRGWILMGIRAVMGFLGKRFKFAGRDLQFNRSRYAPVLSSVLVVYFVGSLILSVSYGPLQKQAIDIAKEQEFLAGQYNYTFQVPFENGPQTAEEYFKALPSKEKANYIKNMIQQEGAFTDVVVISTTPNFLYGNLNTRDAEGNFLEAFNVTLPRVIFNPDVVCAYQPFSSRYEAFIEAHKGGIYSKDDMNYPPRCINVIDVNRTIVVADIQALRVITDRIDSNAEQVLAEGGVVVTSPLYDFNGVAKIRWIKESDYGMETNFSESSASRSEDLKSYLVPNIASSYLRYSAIISPETATKLGIEAHPMSVLANAESPISAEVTDSLLGKGIWFERYVDRDPEGFAWLVTWAAGLFVLLATSIALGLSQIEGASDKRTLAALGAPKSFRARMVASQAFALTFTGALLGGGVGVAVGLTLVMSASMSDFALPTNQLLCLFVGIPVLAAFIFWAFTPRKLNVASRQALD